MMPEAVSPSERAAAASCRQRQSVLRIRIQFPGCAEWSTSTVLARRYCCMFVCTVRAEWCTSTVLAVDVRGVRREWAPHAVATTFIFCVVPVRALPFTVVHRHPGPRRIAITSDQVG
ncbi:unnamed protein product [Prorocentrum cordatum]|uniref:Uncharacterized protein n=1 Tax=Prorocentrum cordatum TaxID=2364126 RepID=A0ABN9XKI1_9DINO|nr:unnamed protein product [Polarella glacialis]